MRPGWRTAPVTVRVPATSANLGPGFDSIGLALSLHDQITARLLPAGLDIQVTGAGAETAAAGERHLVIRAMRAAFDYIGAQPDGIAISCQNAVPHGFGLGSSAAAIVAGLLAARALAGRDGENVLSYLGVLGLGTELEGHPDNVAACLSGGLTIAWQPSPGAVEMARLEPLPGLAPVVCLPDAPLSTEVARQALPARVPHADAAANSARTALLVAGLTIRPELLLAGTEDFLHQRYRADPGRATAALIGVLRAAGIAAAVSGAGPAVLAIPVGAGEIETITRLAAGWRILPLRVDTAGAVVTGS